MTREEIEKIDGMIAVLTAWKEGKQIEYGSWLSGNWETAHEPTWDFSSTKYRVKPEPEYTPYDSISEIDRDKWIKHKGTERLYRIIGLNPKNNSVRLDDVWYSLIDIFERWTYEDGTPCGKLVEE